FVGLRAAGGRDSQQQSHACSNPHGRLLNCSSVAPVFTFNSCTVTSANFLPPCDTVILNGALIPSTVRRSDQLSSIGPCGPAYDAFIGSPVASSTVSRSDCPLLSEISRAPGPA